MNIAKVSITRPVLTTVIFVIIILLGTVSLMRLSIDMMPEVEYPTLTVTTSYGNVGPQEIEESITRPIEESLAAVQGVEEISSTSSEGSSRVRVSFVWGTDLDVAAIVREFTPELEASLLEAAYQVMWDHDFSPLISLRVFDADIFAAYQEKGFSFYRKVAQEGISL